MFMKDGLDGKINSRQTRGCHENALIQSLEKSPNMIGLADYPSIPFKASVIQKEIMQSVLMILVCTGMLEPSIKSACKG